MYKLNFNLKLCMVVVNIITVIYFSDMCHGVYYHLVRFKLNTPLVHEGKKDKLHKEVHYSIF
jgi:hypothetical protein